MLNFLPADNTRLPWDFVIMYTAGERTKVAQTGKPKLDLVKYCEQHIVNMINDGKISHKDFNQRINPLMKKYSGIRFTEIVACTTGNFNNPMAGAKDLFKAWYSLPSHKKALESVSQIYGFSIGFDHQRKNWVAAGIIGK